MQPSSPEKEKRDLYSYVEQRPGIVVAWVALAIYFIFTIGFMIVSTNENFDPMFGFVHGTMMAFTFWMSYKYIESKSPRLYFAVIVVGFIFAITLLLFGVYNFYYYGWTLDPGGVLERNSNLRIWFTAYIFVCVLWAWILSWKDPRTLAAKS